MHRCALIVLFLGLLGCTETPAGPRFDVAIIDGEGRNPARSGGFDSLRINVEQAGQEPTEVRINVGEMGAFGHSVALFSAGIETRVRVRFEGEGSQLIGAAPPFVPLASGGTLRIVAGEPNTCLTLDDARLEIARQDAALVQVGTFGVVAGGLGPDARDEVDFVDLLRLFGGTLEDLPVAGPARGAAFGPSDAVFATTDGVFRYALGVQSDRSTSLDVHVGAGALSSVAEREGGTVVAGGNSSSGVTWLAVDGTQSRSELVTPRQRPALFDLGDSFLVAGGNTEGPVAERIASSQAMGMPIEGARESRQGGVLVAAGSDIVWLGSDADGSFSETFVFRDCPGACRFEAGPAWQGASPTPAVAGQRVLGASQVFRVEADASLIAEGTLAAPREGAGLFELDGGIVLVAGGSRDGIPTRDVEVCFPESLANP